MEKLPLIAEVCEAYNALADGRIIMRGQEAFVDSGDYTKTYTVRFHDDEVLSSDNATVWQHYPGYPILAVQMKLGILSVNWNILSIFTRISWKKRNIEHRSRYKEAIEKFLLGCEEQGYACEDIRSCMWETLETVAKFSYTIEGNRAPMIRE